MIRFVIVALVAIFGWLLFVKCYRFLKHRQIDWTGIATIIGFVALAFYLRQLSGMG